MSSSNIDRAHVLGFALATAAMDASKKIARRDIQGFLSYAMADFLRNFGPGSEERSVLFSTIGSTARRRGYKGDPRRLFGLLCGAMIEHGAATKDELDELIAD
ncbi:hypothetical protein [Streptomyces sp. NBC_01237]|uniref:hypothetical protein n=1 Tax=Streptomyces sp. NBC_01237 TaxID=2903790 RepID=UPI002DD81626|nr:hypothetical protein [Streptomyces sp. NBC_01237]WRZ76439.1 hypothetical protein OG251_35135 [Streptomyces sp. NBC_01237]